MSSAAPAVSVVIATRDRREELRRAIRSVLDQTVTTEVIVLDDASDDGTTDMVRAEFPQARVIRFENREGYVALRNRGAREAQADVFMTFDDDAEFISPRTLELALKAFDEPRVAVVALPTVDLGREFLVRNRAPDGESAYVSDTFPGAASLLRRDVYLAFGGYREELFHRGEESEYSRRLLARGYVVRLVTAPEVHHHVSTARSLDDDVFGQARAQMLQTMWALPYSSFARRALLSLAYGCKYKEFPSAVRGLLAGCRDSYRYRSLRSPLPPALYRLSRRMERERIRQAYSITTQQLELHLPPVSEVID